MATKHGQEPMKRVTFLAPEELMARVEQHRRPDESTSDVLRRLLGYGGWVADQRARGREVLVRGDDDGARLVAWTD